MTATDGFTIPRRSCKARAPQVINKTQPPRGPARAELGTLRPAVLKRAPPRHGFEAHPRPVFQKRDAGLHTPTGPGNESSE